LPDTDLSSTRAGQKQGVRDGRSDLLDARSAHYEKLGDVHDVAFTRDASPPPDQRKPGQSIAEPLKSPSEIERAD
jgi:hypothetical protein